MTYLHVGKCGQRVGKCHGRLGNVGNPPEGLPTCTAHTPAKEFFTLEDFR